MTEASDKRVGNLEYIIAHLPQDLDARFEGVKFEIGEVRDVLNA